MVVVVVVGEEKYTGSFPGRNLHYSKKKTKKKKPACPSIYFGCICMCRGGRKGGGDEGKGGKERGRRRKRKKLIVGRGDGG